jgi:hypothetical protein
MASTKKARSKWIQDMFVTILLSKNVKSKVCKTVILPVVLYVCETSSYTLREEYRLRLPENRVLSKIMELRGLSTGSWRKFHNENSVNCTLHQIL